MPTRVKKRATGGAPVASAGAAVPSVASTRGSVAVTPSSASARAAPLPVSSSPPGLGLGRPEPSGVDTMSDVSVVAAVGGLLSLGGGGSAAAADAQDVDASTEATAVHVDIITRGGDNEQGGEAEEEAGTSVANTKRENRNKTCKLPGCGRYAQSGAEGYCCAHHTDLVGVKIQRKTCKLPGCEKKARGEKGMEGYCQAHFTEFVGGVPKPVPRTQHKKARKPCKLPGCERNARREKGMEGYCQSHHNELVLGGEVQHKNAPRKPCKLEGCEKDARAGKEGYCCAHFTQLVGGEGPIKPKVAAAPKTRGRTCSVPGCPKQVQQGGLCCRHGARSTRGMCRHNGCTNASKRGGLCRRHGAFELATCACKGCKRVVVHGTFCSIHTEGCVETGCCAAATSGYYCQRHYAKPPSRKTVVTGGKSKGKGIKRARTIKKAEESDDNEDYDPSEEEYCRPVKKRQASPHKHRYGTRGVRVSLPPPTPPSSEDEYEEEEKEEEKEEEEMPSFIFPKGSFCNIHTKSVEGSSSGARMASSPTPGGSAPKKRSRSKKTVKDGAERSRKRAKKSASTGEARIDGAIAAVQTRYGTGAEGDKKLSSLTVRGVTVRPSGKWLAQVFCAKKTRYIGTFPSRTQAVLAYEVARELLENEHGVGDWEKSLAEAKEAAFRAVGRRSRARAPKKRNKKAVKDGDGKSCKRAKKSAKRSGRRAIASGQLDHSDEGRIDGAIAAVQTRYGTGVNELSSLTVRGVTMRPSGKWQAQTSYANKSRYLGTFPSRTQAVLAYEAAREILDQESSLGDAERSVAVAREAARKASALAESNEG